MIDFNDYPFINVTFTFYFRVRNSEMYGGKGSVGYSSFSMEECKNITSIIEDPIKLIEEVRVAMAKTLGVTADDLDFITRSEHELATADDDEYDDDFDDDDLGMY